MDTVTMVMLANSRKSGGRCVAGRQLLSGRPAGGWLRPVLGDPRGGLPGHFLRCVDGRLPDLLDRIELPLGAPAPFAHQKENRRLLEGTWRRSGRLSWEHLPSLADPVPDVLWADGFSTACGRNDQVPATLLGGLSGSLTLQFVDGLAVTAGYSHYGEWKVRAEFVLGRRRYNLPVTDPAVWATVRAGGSFVFPPAYLCLSLGTPFNGYAYKLVAAVITEARTREPH